MSSWETIIAAAVGAAVGSILTGVVVEDYRRFRDGAALAAAFGGELASYMLGAQLGREGLSKLIEAISAGNNVRLPEIDKPVDAVYAARVGDLGLLGSALAGELPFIYHQVNAYRVMQSAVNGAEDLGIKKSLLEMALWFLNNAHSRGPAVVEGLRARAAQRYRPFRR